jgi:hypothetical protein
MNLGCGKHFKIKGVRKNEKENVVSVADCIGCGFLTD